MPKPKTTQGTSTSNSAGENVLAADLLYVLEDLKQRTISCIDQSDARNRINEQLIELYTKVKQSGAPEVTGENLKTAVKASLDTLETQFTVIEDLMKSVTAAQRVVASKKSEIMHTHQKTAAAGGCGDYSLASSSAAATLGTSTERKKGNSASRHTLMLKLQNAAMAIPVWTSLLERAAPPLCGAVPAPDGYICPIGDLCVAKLKDVDYWILGEIKSFYQNKSRYSVQDIDEEEKEKYILSRSKVIPLPLYRANPELNPEALFPVSTLVLALYPQTTCFYCGIVQRLPSNPSDNYLIAFEDPSYPAGFSPPLSVPQRYVVASPKPKQ